MTFILQFSDLFSLVMLGIIIGFFIGCWAMMWADDKNKEAGAAAYWGDYQFNKRRLEALGEKRKSDTVRAIEASTPQLKKLVDEVCKPEVPSAVLHRSVMGRGDKQ